MADEHILIVEDDETIALGLEYALGQEGMHARVCGTIAATQEALLTQAFDLVILDINLPDGTGYTLCRHIKEHGGPPVIFLTVHEEEVSAVMGLEMGADDYITKPFRLRELLARVRAVLRRNAAVQHPREMRIGPLRILLAQGRVYKCGTEVNLSATEFRLLLALARHCGQVLSRDQLLAAIWDVDGQFIEDNTLSVSIKRLREKIEDDPQSPRLITTVRGLGYRMEEGE